MPDTWFTAAPDWTVWIIPYFFVGGIAGGAYLISALLVWFGREQDRPAIHAGFYIAFVGAILSAVFLILDLSRPLRFWHMLVQSEEFPLPIIKWYSPISFGSWGLTGFGAIATISALGAAARERRFGLRPIPLLEEGLLWKLLVALGGFFGLFLAGYTGILVTVTNRPVWADGPFMGMMFIASAGSTAAATMYLIGHRGWNRGVTSWLSRFDAQVLVFELLTVIVFLVSLGAAIQAWLSVWGVVMVLGVIVAGILVPLGLYHRPDWFRRWRPSSPKVLAASLVLAGGFLLRLAVIMVQHHIEHARVVVETMP